jgi:hypothetical protein
MRSATSSADDSGKSMHRSQSGIGQRQSSQQTGLGHVFAGGSIAAIVKGGPQ